MRQASRGAWRAWRAERTSRFPTALQEVRGIDLGTLPAVADAFPYVRSRLMILSAAFQETRGERAEL